MPYPHASEYSNNRGCGLDSAGGCGYASSVSAFLLRFLCARRLPVRLGMSPQPWDISIVALMGILGGAMSATFAIQRLRVTPVPISKDLKVWLAFLKLPAGALTAIGGLILISGRFIPGLTDLDTQGTILAYAIVLGVAQQLVTRFVDQKAEDVLAAVPSKGFSPMNAPVLNAEGQETVQMTPAGRTAIVQTRESWMRRVSAP
jgi:hypothetical protein